MFRVAWARGGRCSASCVLCCVAQEFPRKNVSERVLHYGGLKCLVGFGLLDSVDKNTAAHLHPGNQVATLHAGRRKAQDVPSVDWFRATKRSAQALRSRLNLPSLWHRALAAMHGWAGHVARKHASQNGHAAIR